MLSHLLERGHDSKMLLCRDFHEVAPFLVAGEPPSLPDALQLEHDFASVTATQTLHQFDKELRPLSQ